MCKLTEQIEAIEGYMTEMNRCQYRDGFVRRGVIVSIFEPVISNRFNKIIAELKAEGINTNYFMLSYTLDFDVQYGYSLIIDLATPCDEPMQADVPVNRMGKRDVVLCIRAELDDFKNRILKNVNK